MFCDERIKNKIYALRLTATRNTGKSVKIFYSKSRKPFSVKQENVHSYHEQRHDNFLIIE